MPQVKFVKFCHVSNGLASQVNIGEGSQWWLGFLYKLMKGQVINITRFSQKTPEPG